MYHHVWILPAQMMMTMTFVLTAAMDVQMTHLYCSKVGVTGMVMEMDWRGWVQQTTNSVNHATIALLIFQVPRSVAMVVIATILMQMLRRGLCA